MPKHLNQPDVTGLTYKWVSNNIAQGRAELYCRLLIAGHDNKSACEFMGITQARGHDVRDQLNRILKNPKHSKRLNPNPTVKTIRATIACDILGFSANRLNEAVNKGHYAGLPPIKPGQARQLTFLEIRRLAIWRRLLALGFAPEKAGELSYVLNRGQTQTYGGSAKPWEAELAPYIKVACGLGETVNYLRKLLRDHEIKMDETYVAPSVKKGSISHSIFDPNHDAWVDFNKKHPLGGS